MRKVPHVSVYLNIKKANLDKLCGYGRWKPRLAYYFDRAIEGIYTNCRKPVVQKEGINYYGALSFALITESNYFVLPSIIGTRHSSCLFPFIPAKSGFSLAAKAERRKFVLKLLQVCYN